MQRRELLLLGMLFVAGSVFGQTTVGLTEMRDDTNKKLAAAATSVADVEHLTISSASGLIAGSNIKTGQSGKTVYLNGTGYTNTKGYRKAIKDSYEGQNVGYKLTVANGYKMDISGVKARILVADDTYKWYVEILDASGTQLYKSDELTTTKAATASLEQPLAADAVKVKNLTGDVTVQLWVQQGGTAKYFSIEYLTVDVAIAEDSRTRYDVTTSAGEGGSVTPATGAFVEGGNVVLTATPNTGYVFDKWVVDGVETTENPYTISSISAAHTASASFVALKKVTYEKGDGVGDVPAVDYANRAGSYTVASNYFLTKEGYTFSGWSDGVKTYSAGETTSLTGDITLTAQFEANAFALGENAEELTATWALATDDGAPAFECQGATKYYVVQVTSGTETIDVAMFIDTQDGAGIEGLRGKVNVQNNRAQVNAGTVFKLPVVAGSIVSIVATSVSKWDDASVVMTFNGEEPTVSDKENMTVAYTASEAGTLTIIDQGADLYPSSISVTYPVKTVTGVESVEIEDASEGDIYDLAGHKLNKLQRGLNVVGGKLILVK